MKIKAKLRRIGNSMGVILPADVITGYNKGDEIEIEVITRKPETLVKSDKGFDTPVKWDKESESASGSKGCFVLDGQDDSKLAPDGFPIQHTNSMKVGYVPKG